MPRKYDRNDLRDRVPGILTLTTKHTVKLTPRLGETFVPTLSADLEAMLGGHVNALESRFEKQAWTKAQDATLARVVVLSTGMRGSMKTRFSKSPEVLERFGITLSFESKSLSSVVDWAKAFLAKAKKDPDTIGQAGILAEDVAELGQLTATLEGTNQTQEAKKASSKEATADRDAAQARVEEALDKLRAATKLAFRDDPTTLAAFEDALPTSRSSRKKRAKAGGPAAAETDTETETE